jgi:alkylated DNA repair dioxygenase AlkB
MQPERIQLEAGAWIDWYEHWLNLEDATRLYELLLRELAWEQRHVVLFGKPILQPRLIAWAGAWPYRYSGQTLPPRPWPQNVAATLEPLCAELCALAGTELNHVLINRYRDGHDSMGYHADAEPELGSDPLVMTLSLGARRRFALKRHKSKTRGRVFELTSGSLLVMGGTCQQHYRHALLREPAVAAERVSLTFRQILRAPKAVASEVPA